MSNDHHPAEDLSVSIAPWLSVRNGPAAVEFYKAAFGAIERFRIENESGNVVARLAVGGAEFWLSDGSPEHANYSPETLGGGTCRVVMTVADPYGHHWEIARPAEIAACDNSTRAREKEAKALTRR
jgi:PhnB protein